MRRRSTISTSSRLLPAERAEEETIRAGWPVWLYMALVLLGLIAIIVITSITLSEANKFSHHANHAFDTLHGFYKEFKALSEVFKHLKLPDMLPPHSTGKCVSDYSHPYRPYESQYLGVGYDRYVDGHGESDLEREPNPRAVSQTVMAYPADWKAGSRCEIQPNRRGVSAWGWQWGQFIDHEFSLTGSSDQFGVMNIDIKCDPIADPQCHGKSIHVKRSNYKSDKHGVRQQIGDLTPFLDGSAVYGSSVDRYTALRAYEGGRLKTSSGNFMPFNEAGLPNAGGDDRPDLFLGGDVRSNEQLGLTATHTLWMREHNYWADWLHKQYGDWSDDKLYWAARRVVTAEIQAITYTEFLPAILGKAWHSMPPAHYDPKLVPFMTNSFVTAAYRFGHSMVGESLLLYDVKKHGYSCLPLRDTFFKPSNLKAFGMDAVLSGLAHQTAEQVDLLLVDSLRNFLHFAEFIDLASLNIMRGRDHGLPYYHELYHAMTGKHIKDWDDITHDKKQQNKLKNLYSGWDKIDAFIGILAEDPVQDSLLGITGSSMLIDHFQHIRDADPYYYEWDEGLPDYARKEIHGVTLRDVILRNTHLEPHHLPKNVFYVE